jgi:hypothetical protein
MTINEARNDLAKKSKRGISFILASIIIWCAISIVWLLPIQNVLARNFLTFCCAAPLLPLSFLISKVIKSEFSAKDNPLNGLGILFSVNQVIYLVIAIWAYTAAPYNMVMIMAIIFGAHLLPFSWLYKSKAYLLMSIIIPISVIFLGWKGSMSEVVRIPIFMVFTEIVFSGLLYWEIKSTLKY